MSTLANCLLGSTKSEGGSFTFYCNLFEYLDERFTHKYRCIQDKALVSIQIKCASLGKYVWCYSTRDEEET